jgi:UPF0755 protein
MKFLIKILILAVVLGLFFWKFNFHLTKKPVNNEVDITLIEGWTAKQMALAFEKDNLVKAADFLEGVSHPSTSVKSAHPELAKVSNLEGFLFPDTYRFYGSTTPKDVVEKLVNNFFKRLPESWEAQAAKHGLNLSQVVTLASIIEKEVATDQDRRVVADIFLKRLRDKMPLQSDATINYITGSNSVQATFKDITIKSPYNTYDNLGLPPGPIDNPSLSSIMAVLNPESNSYYYFLTTPEGELKVAVTYEQHLANKRKYLR